MSQSITVASYNVRGLLNNVKQREIFHYLHKKNLDVLFLQETHSHKKFETMWSAEWGRKILFVHGETNARGTAMLMSKDFPLIIHNVIRDAGGRYLIVYGSVHHSKYVLVNIYAPNRNDPEFFKRFFVEIERFQPDHKIIAADFNLVWNR